MKNFILQLTTGGKWEITKQEAEMIAQSEPDSTITVMRLGIVAPKRLIVVYPVRTSDQIEDRKKMQRGFLHDGTKVIRHYGQIVIDNGFVPDDNGNYIPVKLDTGYYPEVAKDIFFSSAEWEEVKNKPVEDRKKLIIGLVDWKNEEVSNLPQVKKLSDQFSM